jgi:hypothetical protein
MEDAVHEGLAGMSLVAQGGFEGVEQGALGDDEDDRFERDEHDEKQEDGLRRHAQANPPQTMVPR